MNRREALTAATALLGGTIIGADIFLSGCSNPMKAVHTFGPDEIALLDEVGETIIPATAKSPGAKASKIGDFMRVIVTDCYTEAEQNTFFDGLSTLEKYAMKKGGSPFQQLSAPQRKTVLLGLDQEAEAYNARKKDHDPEHYFSMIKQLTIWGYFSSEPGATKALRYVPIPGRYDGCIDYKAGEGAWVY